jgi:NDP-4-keto-2,6-dideoxyhexose 3-C-methyltransferase
VLAREIVACRACGGRVLDEVLNLGTLAISDFLEPGQAVETAPLCLVRCADCGLVQLRHSVDRDRLYTTYHYRSGVNEAMVLALRDVADDAMRRVRPAPGDAVLDIGSNDGTLLRQYPITLHRIGFDPSDVATAAWLERDFDYDLIRDYFPTTRQHTPVPCKIVTAIAMFYDLEDPGRFLKRWLHPEGVLVLHFQDLFSMMRADAIDNVCHEHLTYWDDLSLSTLLDRHGLAVDDSSFVDINGGSRRVVVRHHGGKPGEMGHRYLDYELIAFVERVQRNRVETVRLLCDLKRQGKTVYGIAASTKFNTLSQFYEIGPHLIDAIGERSPHKVGKHTVTGIPIVSEQAMRDAKPDYLFCCAWQFADAFAEREADLLRQGTKLIVPLPTLRVVEEAALARR